MTTEEARRRQRQIARTCHPDVGGDPEEYLRRLRGLDARPAVVTTRPTLRHGFRRSLRVIRTIRARLPRSAPGARRYIDL